MDYIKSLIEQSEYKIAYEQLKKVYIKDENYYIFLAAALEGIGDVEGALYAAREGFALFYDNYELAFMIGNYLFGEQSLEEAYLYYLLAAGLCDTSDKVYINENINAVDTSALDTGLLRNLLEQLIVSRLDYDNLDKTYGFVAEVLFADNRFLFDNVIDKWLRYFYIILEITACEKNRGLTETAAKRFKDWHEFERIMCEFKFAYRRIWFGFSDNLQQELVELAEKYQVSLEFVVIMGKCATCSEYTAAVLKAAAKLFKNSEKYQMAEVIMLYAEWFAGQQPVNRELSDYQVAPGAMKECEMEVLYVNALKYDMPNNCEQQNIQDMKSGEERYDEECYDVGHYNEGYYDKEQYDKGHYDEERYDKGQYDEEQSGEEQYDENEISYVMCANQQNYVDEVLRYLSRQYLPQGYKLRVYVITNAAGMAAGYNIGMRLSRSRYKVYIHQDTFIFDRYYTYKIVHALQTTKYNMLGLAGTDAMPDTGRWWDCPPSNKRMCLYQDMAIYMLDSVTLSGEVDVMDMDCLDGVLIATDRDVMWREDLFTNFHFYDVSQGLEFARKGYPVGIYNNKVAGVLHEVSVSKGSSSEVYYEESRKVFVREYPQGK